MNPFSTPPRLSLFRITLTLLFGVDLSWLVRGSPFADSGFSEETSPFANTRAGDCWLGQKDIRVQDNAQKSVTMR